MTSLQRFWCARMYARMYEAARLVGDASEETVAEAIIVPPRKPSSRVSSRVPS